MKSINVLFYQNLFYLLINIELVKRKLINVLSYQNLFLSLENVNISENEIN